MDHEYEDYGSDEMFSLEEILAEYKGNSYIDGDKRTPKDVLDEKARRIVNEEMGTMPPDASQSNADFKEVAAFLSEIKGTRARDERSVALSSVAPQEPIEKPSRDMPEPLDELFDSNDFAKEFEQISAENARAAKQSAAERKPERVKLVRVPVERAPEPSERPNTRATESLRIPSEQVSAEERARNEARMRNAANGTPDAARFVPLELPRRNEPPVEEKPHASADSVVQAEPVEEVEREIETLSAEDADVAFFENYRYSSEQNDDEIIKSVNEAILRETEYDEEPRRARYDERPSERRVREASTVDFDYEPDYRERARVFAARCNSLAGRALLALALSIVLAVFTFVAEGGGSLPFGVGRNSTAVAGLLIIIQVLVMLTGLDLLLLGARDIISGSATAETLVFVSNVVSLLAGLHGMITGTRLLPFSAVSALSLSFALWGERLYMEALADSLRSAAKINDPHSVISEFRRDLDRAILRKTPGRFRGFYGNLTQADVCETAHSYAVPLLLLAAIIATILTAVFTTDARRLPSVLASLTAASATFTSTLAFASPFRREARRAKNLGAAIAGAGGVDDIFYTDGFCVTDEDLYPPDSLNVSNIKVLDQVSHEKAVRYTASLVVASGSCLARVFSDMLIKDGMSLFATQDFAASEGGISALIRGENVLVGNFAYMNLFGIRIPDELKLGNSVYTAVDGRLIAMFSVDYKPNDRVRTSLNGLLRRGMRPALTVRDFNITPMTIEQKFKLPMEEFDLLSVSDVYAIGGDAAENQGRTVAVCSRGNMRELSEVVAAGRKIKIISMLSTIVSLSSAVVGLFLMAVLARANAVGAAKPGNLLLFMLLPLVITIVLELVGDAVAGSGGK